MPLLLYPKSVPDPICPGERALTVIMSPLTLMVMDMVWARKMDQVVCVMITSLAVRLTKAEQGSGQSGFFMRPVPSSVNWTGAVLTRLDV